MVPDDQVCVVVVNLREVRGLVSLHVRSAPLDVPPATHQGDNSPLLLVPLLLAAAVVIIVVVVSVGGGGVVVVGCSGG